MAISFRKAEKKRQKLRLAMYGVSGSGKTYSALRIATGFGGRIAVIDSERAASELYSDRFNFDVLALDNFHPDSYSEAMEIAAKEKFDVVVIDSFSHAWYKLCEEVDKIAKAKYKGNTWSAWSDGNPVQMRLIENILRCPYHLIATMRSSTEWSVEEHNGRKTPVRVGTSPNQGKGIEFEFTMLMELSPSHISTFIKDRTGKFQDKMYEKPDELLGKEMLDWLNTGAEVVAPEVQGILDVDFRRHLGAVANLAGEKLAGAAVKIRDNVQYSPSQRSELLAAIERRVIETTNETAG